MRRLWTGVALGAAVAAAASGCRSGQPVQTEVMRQVGTFTISAEELRVRVTSFAERFAGEIESASDAIRLTSDDRRIDEAALIWKIRGVNLVHDAAFRPDPVVSLLDVWVLSQQMLEFAESDAGAEFFGDQQLVAVTTMSTLLTRVDALALSSTSGERHNEAIEVVRQYSAEHPITGRQLQRTSVAAEFAEATGLGSSSALQAVSTLDRRAALLGQQFPFLTEFLPKLLTWQVELTIYQNADRLREELRLARLDGIEANLDRIAVSLEGVPDLVETEVQSVVDSINDLATAQREEVLEGVSVIVEGAIEEVRSERALVLDAVVEERRIVLDEAAALIASEREAALADIERQRLETILSVQAERDELVIEARSMIEDAVSSALDGASGVAMRAAGFGGGLVGVGLVIGAVVLRTGRRDG